MKEPGQVFSPVFFDWERAEGAAPGLLNQYMYCTCSRLTNPFFSSEFPTWTQKG